MLIPNAAVLFFPAWFQLGKDGPRGFETTGQQLILMFGQLLVLALSLAARRRGFRHCFLLDSHLVPAALSVLLGGVVAAASSLDRSGLWHPAVGRGIRTFRFVRRKCCIQG